MHCHYSCTATAASAAPATMASRVLDKKLKKVLDMRTDTPALLESLEAISTLFSDHNSNSTSAGGAAGDGEKAAGGAGHEYSTLDARRSLREDLERQVRGVFPR